MRNILVIYLVIQSVLTHAQQFKSTDYYAKIPSKIENESEIRVYEGPGISNSGRIFRIYSENSKFKAELIQWYYDKQVSDDEFKSVKPQVTQLKAQKSLEEIFVSIQAKNIQYLPEEKSFEYKKRRNVSIWDEDEKLWVVESRVSHVLDGQDFRVVYKSGDRVNEFHYFNPKRYLELYPGIDEYENFVEILSYIEEEFKIKFN
jgi:hypothetical protein